MTRPLEPISVKSSRDKAKQQPRGLNQATATGGAASAQGARVVVHLVTMMLLTEFTCQWLSGLAGLYFLSVHPTYWDPGTSVPPV